MKHTLILIYLSVLPACAIINDPYYYNEIVVRNNTSEVLRDVKIQSMKTNGMFRCANVPPGAQCSDKFPKRKYHSAKLSLFWIYQGKEKTVKDVVLKIPGNMNKETPLRGVLVINFDGATRIYVEQGQI